MRTSLALEDPRSGLTKTAGGFKAFFSSSPLLKNSTSPMGGLAYSWISMESKTSVRADK